MAAQHAPTQQEARIRPAAQRTRGAHCGPDRETIPMSGEMLQPRFCKTKQAAPSKCSCISRFFLSKGLFGFSSEI